MGADAAGACQNNFESNAYFTDLQCARFSDRLEKANYHNVLIRGDVGSCQSLSIESARNKLDCLEGGSLRNPQTRFICMARSERYYNNTQTCFFFSTKGNHIRGGTLTGNLSAPTSGPNSASMKMNTS
jgi:hypothetical protein